MTWQTVTLNAITTNTRAGMTGGAIHFLIVGLLIAGLLVISLVLVAAAILALGFMGAGMIELSPRDDVARKGMIHARRPN